MQSLPGKAVPAERAEGGPGGDCMRVREGRFGRRRVFRRTGLNPVYKVIIKLLSPNRLVHIRHQCRKTTVLSGHSCLINTGVEKMNYIYICTLNFDHQMSLSKSKFLFSNNCLHFVKRCSIQPQWLAI